MLQGDARFIRARPSVSIGDPDPAWLVQISCQYSRTLIIGPLLGWTKVVRWYQRWEDCAHNETAPGLEPFWLYLFLSVVIFQGSTVISQLSTMLYSISSRTAFSPNERLNNLLFLRFYKKSFFMCFYWLFPWYPSQFIIIFHRKPHFDLSLNIMMCWLLYLHG